MEHREDGATDVCKPADGARSAPRSGGPGCALWGPLSGPGVWLAMAAQLGAPGTPRMSCLRGDCALPGPGLGLVLSCAQRCPLCAWLCGAGGGHGQPRGRLAGDGRDTGRGAPARVLRGSCEGAVAPGVTAVISPTQTCGPWTSWRRRSPRTAPCAGSAWRGSKALWACSSRPPPRTP